MNGGDLIKFAGEFDVRCYNRDGTLAWREKVKNGTTTAGINHILATEFGGGAQVATWFKGLINNAAFGGVAAGDTMASHSGWTEWTSYSEGARQEWVEGAPSGGVIASSASATFTMSAAGELVGAFLTSSSTKGGSTGTLWATGLFNAVQTVTSGQTIQVTYTCTGTGS